MSSAIPMSPPVRLFLERAVATAVLAPPFFTAPYASSLLWLSLLPAFCFVRPSPPSSSTCTSSYLASAVLSWPSLAFIPTRARLSCLISSSLSILSLPSAVLLSSFSIRVLQISSWACCLVPALAGRHPMHPGVYPNCTMSLCLTRNGITSTGHTCGLSTGSVLTAAAVIYSSNSIPSGDPFSRITASASHLVLWQPPERPSSHVSVRSAYHQLVRSRCHAREQSVLPSHIEFVPFAVLRHWLEQYFLPSVSFRLGPLTIC